jgi:ankyrin repeat protein
VGEGRPTARAVRIPLTIIGTVFVCSGIYLCAFIVGQSTKEYVFSRANHEQKDRSIIYWVQPGPQVLGDQTFDSFCYSDGKKALRQYTTSWKRPKKYELAVWAAVGVTVAGFVLQFVGLRGIHSAVSVAQLGATLFMSAARGALRMERLDSDDNLFADCQDKIVGHELDWLAIHLGHEHTRTGPGSPGSMTKVRTVCLWRFSGAVFDPNNSQMIGHGSLPGRNGSNLVGRIFAYRSRLAELTESPANKENPADLARNFKSEMVEIRSAAGQLTVAIETTFNMVFASAPQDREDWKNAKSAFLRLICSVSTTSEQPVRFEDVLGHRDRHDVYVELCRQSTDPKDAASMWKFKKGCELEAILRLWVWSMKSDLALTKTLDLRNRSILGARRIVSWGEDPDRTVLMVWLPSKILCVDNEVELKDNDIGDSNILWKRIDQPDTNEPRGRPMLFESLTKESLGDIPSQDTYRLFGWHVRERVTPAHPDTEAVPIWTTPTNSTLLSLCVQEIFAASVKSMLSVINSIGDIEIVEKYQDFGLSNRLFSDIVDEFETAGLGSRDEGFLCILPPLVLGEFREGRTPLLYAAKLGHALMVEWLLEKGNFDPSLPDREGGTPLWWAAKNGNEAVAQQLLDDYSTDPNFGDADARTPLLCAAENGHEGVVKRLLDDDRVAPNQQDRIGATPLSCAAAKGHEAVVNLLLDAHKADRNKPAIEPDLKDSDGMTPLSHAAANGYKEVVKLLLANSNVDAETRDSQGRSPLSHAAANGHEEVVKLLLANSNVDAESRDLHGRTPLSHATRNGHEVMVKLLNDRLNPALTVPDNGKSGGDRRYHLVLRHPLPQQVLTTRQTTTVSPVPGVHVRVSNQLHPPVKTTQGLWCRVGHVGERTYQNSCFGYWL